MVSLENILLKIMLVSSLLLVGPGLAHKVVKEKRSAEDDEDERITGGVPAKKFQFPFIVHLTIVGGGGTSSCGGSIITENWILTAAHCVTGMESAKVIAGVLRRNDKGETGRQERSSSQIIIHEDYKQRTQNASLQNDIALIRLSRPLEISDEVKTILLPDGAVNDTHGSVITAGWGAQRQGHQGSEELRMAELSIVSRDFCQQKYNKTAKRPPPKIQTNEICAQGSGKSACSGDSGGPLVCTSGNTKYLCGIVSWSIDCGNRDFPGVYARVKSHHEWIVKISNSSRSSNVFPCLHIVFISVFVTLIVFCRK